MFRASGVAITEESQTLFRAAYERCLRRRILEPETIAQAPPRRPRR